MYLLLPILFSPTGNAHPNGLTPTSRKIFATRLVMVDLLVASLGGNMKLNQLLHQLNYIFWKNEETYKIIKINDFEEKLKYYRKNGHLVEHKTIRKEWDELAYYFEEKGYYHHLYTYEGVGKYVHYSCNSFDDSKNKVEVRTARTGRNSNRIEQKLFKEFNGVTERVAFGYCDRELIYNCIPKQLYYINKKYLHKNLTGISKVDYSSHYPDNMRGQMPDWKTSKQFKGRVEPTEEYPFAFYVKSGMCAEYGRFDMHDWLNSRYVFQLFGNRYTPIEDDDDITILCKASKYTFDKVIEHLYEKKQKGEQIDGIDAKMVLNASIGFKHLSNKKNKRSRLDHIAAIVLGRANQQMLDIVDILGDRVLQIIVDGIIYKGKMEIGVKEKYLGALRQEITDCDFRMRGTNQYIFFKDGKCICECHGGLNDNLKTEKLEDIEEWRRVL